VVSAEKNERKGVAPSVLFKITSEWLTVSGYLNNEKEVAAQGSGVFLYEEHCDTQSWN
jgi:hypothetical protein